MIESVKKHPGFWIVIGLAALYAISGYMSLSGQREDLRVQRGLTWDAIDTGQQKLGNLQSQVLYAYTDRQDLVAQITAARNDILAAQQADDMDAALAAVNDASVAVNALVESNPEIDLTPLQIGLFDETAGTFNRISYQRSLLITMQGDYNKSRRWYPFHASMFPREEVLGGNADVTDITMPDQFKQQ